MADIVIRGIEVSENLDIIKMGNKVVYSTNKWNDMEEASGFVILPEGYSRLIDVDKLTPDMGTYITGGFGGTVGSMCTARGYSQRQIDNAPTILEAEAKEH